MQLNKNIDPEAAKRIQRYLGLSIAERIRKDAFFIGAGCVGLIALSANIASIFEAFSPYFDYTLNHSDNDLNPALTSEELQIAPKINFDSALWVLRGTHVELELMPLQNRQLFCTFIPIYQQKRSSDGYRFVEDPDFAQFGQQVVLLNELAAGREAMSIRDRNCV